MLGYRLACLAEHDLFGGKILRGPRLEKIALADTPYGQQVRVKFTSVNGGLKAAGRAYGFNIGAGPDGPDAPCIFDQEIAPDDPTVVILRVGKTAISAVAMRGVTVHPHARGEDQSRPTAPTADFGTEERIQHVTKTDFSQMQFDS